MSLTLFSCAEKEPAGSSDPSFRIETKAVADLPSNTTYRVVAYYGTASANPPYVYASSGTYRSEDGNDLLRSCLLDPDGGFINDNPSSSLNGLSGSFFLVLASPGKAINDDGSFMFTPDDPDDDLKFNRIMQASLGNYGAITFTKPMYDNRTKVGFKIYKNISESVENITVSDAYLTSVNAQGEAVRVYPSVRQVKVADLKAHRSLTLFEKDKAADGTGHLLFYESQPITVASGYYAPKSVVASTLSLAGSSQAALVESNYIYFGCKLKQGNRDAVSIRIPLNATAPELQPQMEYIYRITISSNFISLDLDIYDASSNDWQDGGSFEEEISRPAESYPIGTWTLEEWEGTDDLTQII